MLHQPLSVTSLADGMQTSGAQSGTNIWSDDVNHSTGDSELSYENSNKDTDAIGEEQNLNTGDDSCCPESGAEADDKKHPGLSYIALISMAIQSSSDKKMLLSEIYGWIAYKYRYYQMKDKSWRNSIRHNLSLNECFVKNGRSENGKGNYWSIHPANIDDFSRGDYRRRRARRRVRKCDEDLQRLCSNVPSPPPPQPQTPRQMAIPKETYDGYVPMVSTLVPSNFLSALGMEQGNSCDDWTSAHAHYSNYTADAYPDYKHISKNCNPRDTYFDSQYFSTLLDGQQHKTTIGTSSYLGHPSWNSTHATTQSPIPSESTFNVNVNVNVCGNSGISQPRGHHVY